LQSVINHTMKLIKATNYSIIFDQEDYSLLAILLQEGDYSSFFVLVDEHTKEFCLPIFNTKIDLPYELITIPSGESHKNLETCTNVWNKLAALGANRKSVLINIGGGMLTDIGGFIASTFKRGMPFINIPTSLLGMVDASVGGKTGIDFNGLKNQIGLFANPEMVVIDTEYLNSLPLRERISGMAEIIKYALTYDANLWENIKLNFTTRKTRISEFVHRSIEIKNEIVLKDPKEQNLRKILNYGHTIGHAVETFFLQSKNKQTLTHGEAVAIGLVCETYISNKLYNFPKRELTLLKKHIHKLFGKIHLDKTDYKAILDLMKHDKKNIQGEVRFVLLEDLAKTKIDCVVETTLIVEALDYYNLQFF